MPSDCPSASTLEADAAPARLSSPIRWNKQPSSGPLPRTGGDHPGLNRCPRGPPSSRSELKRRLRASVEAAALALAAAEAARGSHPHASVPVDGGLEDVQRLGPAGFRVDAGHGTAGPKLWSGSDEVTLLAAAAAFRERTGRAPRQPDAGALFDEIKASVSGDIDADEAYDRLNGFEGEFLNGTLGASDDAHDRRVRDLGAVVWGAVDVVRRPVPDDDSGGEEAGEQDAEEGRLVADEGESDGDATERPSKPAPLPRFDAQLPSEGPSASATDTDVVPTLPSPSRSMKRSFHPQPSVDDGHPGRTSSPRRLGASADIAALAPAAAAAARGPDDITVHVDRERNDVQSHGTADVRAEVGDGIAQRLERADHGAAARDSHKVWSDADEVAFLNATVAFRHRVGRAPRDREVGVLLRSIGGSISPHIDEAKASYKLGRLRSMFRQEAPGECATAHDHCLHDLSAKVWGNVVARDEGATMPVATEMLGEFWKVNARAMAGLPLEKGLSLLGKKEARLIETKWRQQLDEEMQTQMKRHDLAKEICGLLNDTIMELDP